jgi:hypothetical protein
LALARSLLKKFPIFLESVLALGKNTAALNRPKTYPILPPNLSLFYSSAYTTWWYFIAFGIPLA